MTQKSESLDPQTRKGSLGRVGKMMNNTLPLSAKLRQLQNFNAKFALMDKVIVETISGEVPGLIADRAGLHFGEPTVRVKTDKHILRTPIDRVRLAGEAK